METDYIKNIDDAERRMFSEPVEMREEGNEKYIEGYAFVFGATADLGGFTEEVAPGAADGVMNDDVRGLLNHEPNIVLGRTKSGTMTLELDARGLKYRIKYNPNDPDHVSAREKILRGDISQSSFAFRVKGDKWETRNGKDHRIITKFSRLIDVSPVTYPAYQDATVAARSLSKIVNNNKDLAEMDLDIMGQDLRAMMMDESSSSDMEFIKKMIPHHQMAIDMVNEFKGKVKNRDLIKIMENILTSQASEIERMKKIKGQNKTK